MTSKRKRSAPEDEPGSGRSSKRRGRARPAGKDSKKLEGGDDQAGNIHPLLNSLVLETVFQYTGTLEEVKRNRLVCRTWKNAAEPQWTTLTKTLKLFRSEVLPQEADLPSDQVVMTLEQLREMCYGTKSALEKVVRYRKFKFQNWTFANLLHSVNTINGPITTDRWFWNRIAPNLINSLILNDCQFPVSFSCFEQWFLRAMPNLERLSVINCTTTWSIISNAFMVWYTEQRSFVFLGDGRRRLARRQRPRLAWKHENLKFLHLAVPGELEQGIQPMGLLPFLELVRNPKGLRIEGGDTLQDGRVLRSFVLYMMVNPVTIRTLVELDLLDFSTRTYKKGSFHIFDEVRPDVMPQFDSLEVLHYDLGYGPEASRAMSYIQDYMPVLQKLNLYRAPFSEPLTNFFDGTLRPFSLTITELHLWGNVSLNMDFLNRVPNLQMLKWSTSCYEEKFGGRRVMKALEDFEELRTYPLLLMDLISQTSEEVQIRLEQLTTFELDCGPISGTSWKRLGEWMPNLKNLKAIVSRAEHLGLIREQWKLLESLELSHGSKLPGGRLLKELVKFEASLKTFQWKGCACTRKLFGKRVASGLQETEKKLGSQLPAKCTFPWNANLEGDQANLCNHAVFEETLMSKAVSPREWSDGLE